MEEHHYINLLYVVVLDLPKRVLDKCDWSDPHTIEMCTNRWKLVCFDKKVHEQELRPLSLCQATAEFPVSCRSLLLLQFVKREINICNH